MVQANRGSTGRYYLHCADPSLQPGGVRGRDEPVPLEHSAWGCPQPRATGQIFQTAHQFAVELRSFVVAHRQIAEPPLPGGSFSRAGRCTGEGSHETVLQNEAGRRVSGPAVEEKLVLGFRVLHPRPASSINT